jgi:hypothetical protein
VEETALHAAFKQVITETKGDVTVSLPIDPLSDDCSIHRYYFLCPKKPRKAGGKSPALNTLCAFGPYSSSWVASFIRTSACAFGLFDADAVA